MEGKPIEPPIIIGKPMPPTFEEAVRDLQDKYWGVAVTDSLLLELQHEVNLLSRYYFGDELYKVVQAKPGTIELQLTAP